MISLLLPSKNYLGEGCIEHLYEDINGRDIRTCLIVTDSFLQGTTTFKRVATVLAGSGVGYKVFNETKPNPSMECVRKAHSLIASSRCDLIISIGGGSAHDLAKAVGIMQTNEQDLRKVVGVDKLDRDIPPLVCINTTSGTGSEVTRFTIITDKEKKQKMAIIDSKLIPWISINDTDSLMTMPKGLTAATGMDALTHCIEAYLSTDSTSMTNAYALEGIRLISRNIFKAYNNGSDKDARENMAKGQFMAGVAFSNASLGFVHGIAHQLGGIYNLPHGVCNAVLLPLVLEEIGMSLEGARLKDIANAMGIDSFHNSNRLIYPILVKRIREMNRYMIIPKSLAELGVLEEDIKQIASMALEDACSLTSPIKFTKKQITELLMRGLKELR